MCGLVALRGGPACLEYRHSTTTESPLSTWRTSATRRGPVATRATAVLLHTWQRHIKSHPATRGGGKLNGQSNVLPCVFAGSVVSDTSQRLWPGAHWTVAALLPRDSIWYTAWNRRQTPPSAPYSHEGHIPSILEGIRDSYKLQGVYGHVLDENVIPIRRPDPVPQKIKAY